MQPDVLFDMREKIDEIDSKMAELFEERMTAVLKISEYKKAHDLPIFDKKREETLIEQNAKLIKSAKLKPYYCDFLKSEMAISKAYQNDFLASCSSCSSCSNKKSIFIKTKLGGYKVKIERGAIKSIANEIDLNRKVLIITDDGVPKQYCDIVLSQCENQENSFVFVLNQGELSKTPQSLFDILDCLLKNNFSRHDLIIALGGGVIGDLAGLVASLFMRGIDFLNIPTTTLSQIDSSIGSKTAIDFLGAKNIIGSFYPPIAVIIDADVLTTLPKRHYNNGLIEALKAGLIYDKDLFSLFYLAQKNNQKLDIDEIIYRSLLVKKAIVEQDENENGIRKILNFGHTIGHALEALSLKTNSPLLHGEAVSLGMLSMVDNASDRLAIMLILKYLSMPDMPKFPLEEILEFIKTDKKSKDGYIETVRIKSIEPVNVYIKSVKPDDIIKQLQENLLG